MLSKIESLVRELKEQNLLLPIWFEGGRVVALDQTRLPFEEVHLNLATVEEVAAAIREMRVRGSGAIALAGAWGLWMEAASGTGSPAGIERARLLLQETRPTAVSLRKTLDEIAGGLSDCPAVEIAETVGNRVMAVVRRHLAFERAIGSSGAGLIQDGATVLTHCHSGALAGAGYGGRALSPIRAAVEQGKAVRVIACETRPYLQGSRITAWELLKLGVPVTLITDGMSGLVLKEGMADLVIVGSDRVAANGDLANKVGTYLHALAARESGVPFYSAASSHTIDLAAASGQEIEIELRDPAEVLTFQGKDIAPPGVQGLYPAFDITPAALIAGFITERGLIRPPYRENLARIVDG